MEQVMTQVYEDINDLDSLLKNNPGIVLKPDTKDRIRVKKEYKEANLEYYKNLYKKYLPKLFFKRNSL